MTKILYVLVSSMKDHYYEQAFVSMLSLKHVDPNSFISLLVDSETAETLRDAREKILNLVSEYKIITLPSFCTQGIQKSRYLKTTMRKYVHGDFLYVDVDTIWCSPINENDFTEDVMAVNDGNCAYEDNFYRDEFYQKFSKVHLDFEPKKIANSGVLYVRDSDRSHQLFSSWHNEWMAFVDKGVCTDQQALEAADIMQGRIIQSLDDSYNVQITFNLNHISEAKIIHYFASSFFGNFPYLLQQLSFWEKNRNCLDIKYLNTIIMNPKSLFSVFPFQTLVPRTFVELSLHPFVGFLMNEKMGRFLLKFGDAFLRIYNKCRGTVGRTDS